MKSWETTGSYSLCKKTNKIWNEVNRLHVSESSQTDITKWDDIGNHGLAAIVRKKVSNQATSTEITKNNFTTKPVKEHYC